MAQPNLKHWREALVKTLETSTPEERTRLNRLCKGVRRAARYDDDGKCAELKLATQLEILASIGLLADIQAEAQREEGHDGVSHR